MSTQHEPIIAAEEALRLEVTISGLTKIVYHRSILSLTQHGAPSIVYGSKPVDLACISLMVSFEIVFGLEELFEVIIGSRDFFCIQGLLMPIFHL